MLKTGINEFITEEESSYSLVIAVAKRARDIAEKAEMENRPLVEKPVSLALDELRHDELTIIHPSPEDAAQ